MEFEQLRQLVAIADYGTMQAAAAQLHLSPSALSRSLRRLEDELGQQLFDRTKNSLRINDYGRLALEHGRTILAVERRMHDDFAAIAKRARTIRVSSVAPAPTWRLSSIVLAQNPTTIIEPDIVSAEEARGRLLNNACDFAVTTDPLELPITRSIVLLREDLYANVPIAHELCGRDTLTFDELDGQIILVYGGIGYWHEVHERMLPHSHFVTQPDRTVFLQQVRTSDLLTFTTNAPENTSGHESRRAIPITNPEAHATFWLSMRVDASDAVQAAFALVEAASGSQRA